MQNLCQSLKYKLYNYVIGRRMCISAVDSRAAGGLENITEREIGQSSATSNPGFEKLFTALQLNLPH